MGAAKVTGAVSVLLLVAGVSAWAGRRGALQASVEDASGLSEIPMGQKNWSFTMKEHDLCSTIKDNCMTTKCCKASSHKCIKKSETEAKCAPYCPSNGPCTVLTQALDFDTKERTSLYCFTVYVEDDGSPKKSYDKELLSGAYERKASIFGCDAYAVYSDVETSLGGLTTNKLEDVDGDWKFAKRKLTGQWVNTGIYYQAWKAIRAAGVYSSFDWTIKADADAVFFPKKLVSRIHLLPVPPQGAFLQNCPEVDYGFFGSLEVISKSAFSIFLANLETCKTKTVSDWKVGVKKGKYGPMGEDLFAQICMQKNGVAMLDAFDISSDGLCKAKKPLDQKKTLWWHADCSNTYAPAIHPVRHPDEYFSCLEAAAPLM